MTCYCGHEEDEHFGIGDDPEYPGSRSCGIDDCLCIMFEPDDAGQEGGDAD